MTALRTRLPSLRFPDETASHSVAQALILLLGALQFQLFVGIARAESSEVGSKAGAGGRSVQVERVNPGDVGLEPRRMMDPASYHHPLTVR
jgi:hypothetical protein